MISESEIIRRIRISDLGSANKSYADEVIEKYKIAAKTRLQHPTLTQKWVIDNQRQVIDVNDRTKIIGGRGSSFFDRIEKMIKTESEVIGFLGSKYSVNDRRAASRVTFWERLDMRILGNPKFSGYNAQLKKDEEQILAEKLEPKVVKTKIVDPVIVASSSLLPLGIIGLLLYTSMGKK